MAALVVPVGFALSLETPKPRVHTQTSIVSAAALLQPMPDSAKLLLIGTTLFGLAAFVRKAI